MTTLQATTITEGRLFAKSQFLLAQVALRRGRQRANWVRGTCARQQVAQEKFGAAFYVAHRRQIVNYRSHLERLVGVVEAEQRLSDAGSHWLPPRGCPGIPGTAPLHLDDHSAGFQRLDASQLGCDRHRAVRPN